MQSLLLIIWCVFWPMGSVGRSSTAPSSGRRTGVVVTTSRAFADANGFNASGDSDWAKRLRWIPQKDIKIVRFIDSGRFSNVFEARLDTSAFEMSADDGVYWSEGPSRAVLKVLKHTFGGKAKREIRLLELLRSARGVVRLLGVSSNSACFPKTVSLIFEHLPGAQWLSHVQLNSPISTTGSDAAPRGSTSEPSNEPQWSLAEIRLFSYKLLDALRECHNRGVMHRDIKPRNVIVQRQLKQLRLIDFGLSELYVPRAEYNPSVASRHYKCPELLLNYCYYDYAVDIWAAGCIIAGLIFKSEPFFYGADLLDQVTAVASIVGSKAILDWAAKYALPLSLAQRKAIGKHPSVPLERFCNEHNSHLCCDEAIDLLRQMLCVDHQERATADGCLAHPFFDQVRGARV